MAEDFECELITERLNVKGLYTIEFEFEHFSEIPEDMKNEPHFNRDPMFGQFEMTIDRNKQCTFENPTICGIDDNGVPICTRFKLSSKAIEIIRKQREAFNLEEISDGEH